mgnify:CR=1 FL=1
MSRWSLVEALRGVSPVQAVLRVAWPPVWELAQRLDGIVRRGDAPSHAPSHASSHASSSIHVPPPAAPTPTPAAPDGTGPEVLVRSFGSVYLVTMRYRGTVRATWCCARTHRRLATRTLARA